jgi:hypothetical protein
VGVKLVVGDGGTREFVGVTVWVGVEVGSCPQAERENKRQNVEIRIRDRWSKEQGCLLEEQVILSGSDGDFIGSLIRNAMSVL